MMMTKNIHRALKANGLSFLSILVKSIFSGMLLTVAFAQEFMVEINETIDLVARQSELTQKLIDKMGAKMKAHEDKTRDSDESEYSSSSSDVKSEKGKLR